MEKHKNRAVIYARVSSTGYRQDTARQVADLKRYAGERGLPRMSAQAVGGAVGHNPVSIIIPCHRVIGSDGSLTGYAGGLERKRRLLELEGVLLS